MTGVPALWVKICGLGTAADVAAAAEAGVDAVGFVFHVASPRHLDPAAAAGLQRAVPPCIERVAVFRHPAQALVDAVLEAIRPDALQTDAADFERLRLPSQLRRLPVLRSGAASPPLPARFLYESAASGAGVQADWAEAARLARDAQLVLAGGLDAGNVGQAIARVRPAGVDVSSGVERARGVKDAGRMRDFVSAARAAQAALAAAV